MTERSWGSPREVCEQGAGAVKALMPVPPYRWLFLVVPA
jgi:hypothetical protein